MHKEKYLIAGDIQSMSRFSNFHVRDIVLRYISQSIRMIYEKHVTTEVVSLDEKELVRWVKSNTPPDTVILSPAYSDNIQSVFSLRLTRMIDESLEVIPELQSLRQSWPISNQLRNLGIYRDHTLFTDFILSGHTINELVALAKLEDVFIKNIITCVAVKSGLSQMDSHHVYVESFKTFDKLLGKVSERDLIPGLPFCGKTMLSSTGETFQVPVLLPWGKPSEWAGIPPKKAISFSKDCLRIAIEFWEEVYPSVRFFEVPSIVYDPSVTSTDVRFIDYLFLKAKNL